MFYEFDNIMKLLDSLDSFDKGFNLGRVTLEFMIKSRGFGKLVYPDFPPRLSSPCRIRTWDTWKAAPRLFHQSCIKRSPIQSLTQQFCLT